MAATPLYDTLIEAGARMGDYAGVETPSVFTDVSREFRELSSGCAMYDLGWRAKIVLTGEDRVRWLNGMVTNNIKDLPRNHGNYSFVLNPQGRILGDLYTYNRGDSLLIDTERSQLKNLLKLFEHYIIMDDVEVRDNSEALTEIGIQGPNTTAVLKKAGIIDSGLERMQVMDLTWNGISLSLARMASTDPAKPRPAAAGLAASSPATVSAGHGCSTSGGTCPGCRSASGAAEVP